MDLRAWDDGKSEGHTVTVWIGVEPHATALHTKVGRIPSGVSSRDRQIIHPDKGRQLMMGLSLWCTLDPVHLAWWQLAFIAKDRQDLILSPRVLVYKAFERLEPCAGKLASTVLRGPGGRNAPRLPGRRFLADCSKIRRSRI
jgi:hypothetical protein